MIKHIDLSRGRISVTVNHHHPEWKLDDLLSFAERINPKRAFLFVSKVLGKHIPVAPSVMQKSYQDLAALIPKNLPYPISVIGMAETAVGLGAGVYRELKPDFGENAIFLTTTRHPVETLPTLGLFLEEHSHAQDQFILSSHDAIKHQHILSSKTLILVDDEISTGKTFRNLILSLKKSGLEHVERIILVTLVNWAEQHLVTDDLGIPVEVVSLLHGHWQWQDNNKEIDIQMPNVSSTQQQSQKIIAPNDWGREPTFLECSVWQKIESIQAHEKVLVLGSGEFTWIPFLMAEQLEKQGVEVYFSSTTRSPIMQGQSIESICLFKDNYGLNMNNYAYNVKHQEFDRVFLIIETAKDSVDPLLFEQIKNLEIISYEC
ncbi:MULTISPECIES: phosphoribosyltransferase domain-containing protein [Acinetobacter]|uniref:phosphoribosyltransferase domain-containing protein n=1 Tax=Acinetobacter TaxID=469 RepID=UPI000ABB3EE7|nr:MULTISPECIES: phosphoribosyltransferase domain-containing protein [Acinetobacter]MDA3580659.1 phosphoribosyltransferase family protein [Acinetobacter ursingii]MDG9950301.1 phosphoribosyltransferase family protein [Acinetobacter ursingii]MDH0192558.1 phosphoribosyltransferase family protein [Acinetobacter ursingii]MDH0809148.1 phosphoribosyltransferase family protein [Acinetobacter ursingii]MDH2076430.1 phosphoribosyltransferase family protein [Acinetobacter ursingii]